MADLSYAGDPKQAAEYHTGLLDSAVKHFHEARVTFEEAQAAVSQAADQVSFMSHSNKYHLNL